MTGPTVLQAALQKKTARKRKSQSSTETPDTPVPDTPTLDVSTANLNLSVNLEKKETEKSPSSAPRLTGKYLITKTKSISVCFFYSLTTGPIRFCTVEKLFSTRILVLS